MRLWFCLALALVVAPVAAQADARYASLVGEAWAAYEAGRPAASDSLYTLAFEAGTPTAADLYNAACSAALAGHTDRAFALLGRAADAGYENVEHARTDGDLAPLRADAARWAAFESAVAASMAGRYGADFDADLRGELVQIRETDQGGRMAMDAEAARYEGAARDSAVAAVWARQAVTDAANLARVEAIIAARGWPGFGVAGRDGSNAAWLVIQHAPLETQQRYLPVFQAAVDAGQAAPSELALLVDRIRVRTDRPQLYGSQARRDPATGAMGFYPIEDEPNVDARRAAVGLGPLSAYARLFGFEYAPPAE